MSATEQVPKAAAEEAENEYVALLSKRLKKQKKKLANVAEIEAKVKSGSKINADQQQALDSKEAVAKSVAELEGLRLEYVKLQQQGEKLQKRLKKKNAAEAEAEKERDRSYAVRHIVELFQAARLLDGSSGARMLADLIAQPDKGSSNAVQHATKYISGSDESVASSGLTYKSVFEQVSQLFASSSQQDALPTSELEGEAPAAVAHTAPSSSAGTVEPTAMTTTEETAEPSGTAGVIGSDAVAAGIGEWGATAIDDTAPTDEGGWSETPPANGVNGGRDFAEQRRSGRGRGGRGERGGYGSRGGGRGDRGGEFRRGGYRGRGGDRGGEPSEFRGSYRGRGGEFRGHRGERARGGARGGGPRGGSFDSQSRG